MIPVALISTSLARRDRPSTVPLIRPPTNLDFGAYHITDPRIVPIPQRQLRVRPRRVAVGLCDAWRARCVQLFPASHDARRVAGGRRGRRILI